MNNFKYSLEKYRNRNQKHNCPRCDKRSFVRYVDNETNTYLDKDVGRCDHQDGCGYHYTPKEYHKDNNITMNNTNYTNNNTYYYDKTKTRTAVPRTNVTNGTNGKKEQIDSIPFKYIEEATKTLNSTLIEYFHNLFDEDTIRNTVDNYFIGCTKDRAVVYPQIDANEIVRTAKEQKYNAETGKRIKDEPYAIGWLHTKLIKKGLLPKDFQLKMCLFGEHLISSERFKNMPVGIVESEKSALIASGCMPDIVWMAAGAKDWLNVDKLKPLKERKIILYPDTSSTGNAFDRWTKIANEAKGLGYNISVSTLLENKCTDEEKAKGYDLGDYLIDRLLKVRRLKEQKEKQSIKPPEHEQMSTVLSDMIKENPLVATLKEVFGLVVV